MTKRDAKDEKKAPKLRFKGFTDDWEQHKLADLSVEVKGNDGVVEGLPILTISAANGWMNQKDRFSQVIAGSELKKYTLLNKGELSYNHGNSKLAKFGAVFELDSYKEALVPRVYHSFKMVNGNSPSFIEYLFATKRPDRELSKLITSGARMDGLLNINKKDFFSIKLKVPTPQEQTKISKLLRGVDRTITLHEEKQKQLEQLKKALLQKMFADKSGYPKVRFKGFSEPWEQHKLVDLSEEVKGNDGVVDGLPILTISATNGWMNQKDRFSQVIAGSELKKYTLLKKGELSYNHGNSKLAKFGAVFELDSYKEALVPRVYHSFKMVNGNSPSFIEYLFATKRPDRELSKLITSGARMDGLLNINKKDFFGIKLKVPTPQEQTKISKLLRGLDRTITLHAKKIESLKQLKQALLQQMFI